MSVSQLIKTKGSRLLLSMTLCHWMNSSQCFKDLNAFKTLWSTPLSAQCHRREDLDLQHLHCDNLWSHHPLNCICLANELEYSTNIRCWVTAIRFKCKWLRCFDGKCNVNKISYNFCSLPSYRFLESYNTKSWVWLSLESLLFPAHNFWDEILIYYNVVIECGGL
jgi:hypothetical protein